MSYGDNRMIKIENVVTPSPEQWEAVVRGTRNPFNSWSRADSEIVVKDGGIRREFVLGENDLNLMKRLAKAGDDHGKFMRMLPVIVDITAPHYWWPEMDQYKVGTVTDSCSKMHTLLAKPFELDDFSYTTLTRDKLEQIIECLNFLREKHQDDHYRDIKEYIWQSILETLPMGYLQKRTWSANYQTLKHIYHARKNHKLQEWKDFCHWIETLPYARELIVGEE